MKGKQVLGILLVVVGAYTYHKAASGEGFLGMTNSTVPGLAIIAVGVLILTGVLKV